MTLQRILRDTHNSLSLDKIDLNTKHFNASLKHLSGFCFWPNAKDSITSKLWAHQEGAISLALAYLHSNQKLLDENNTIEAALLKLPTGAGKSGVIAVLSRCLPQVKKVLVLVPRAALSVQLRQDIKWRFWNYLKLQAREGETFIEKASVLGRNLETASIVELLPSNVDEISKSAIERGRCIVVGTLQALDHIKRSSKQSFDVAVHSPNGALQRQAMADTLQILSNFDLVIVDEGHYEPAASWSRCVRELGLPTILLSATPYRNDYKSFRVRGRYVYNAPIQEMVQKNIVRQVKFFQSRNKNSSSGTPFLARFIQLLRESIPTILKGAKHQTDRPKLIIRAASYENLLALQKQIEVEFGELPILIHHQESTNDKGLRRFHDVHGAFEQFGSTDARFWLHDRKLLEGIDDPTFVAVAIYDPFANARELVQQIGRIIRSTNHDRKVAQTCWGIAWPDIQMDLQA